MIGKTVSHYKIIEQLGEGGMGVVYKAEDLKLSRLIALKFLPSSIYKDPDRKSRFLQEAKAVSQLDHNNVCTIHEFAETDDGQMYLVMAHYEGESLKNLLKRKSPSFEQSIDIIRQLPKGK